eukprot:SAG31_NODE_1423_length_8400_cov_2.665944_1_plen_255_part_00
MACRLWAVVLVISEVHYHHHGLAVGCFWTLVRGCRWGVMWLFWLVPSVWVACVLQLLRIKRNSRREFILTVFEMFLCRVMWWSGLWTRLALRCWSCFNQASPSKATEQYRVASASYAAFLSVIAISCLLWAQAQSARSRVKRTGQCSANLSSQRSELLSTAAASSTEVDSLASLQVPDAPAPPEQLEKATTNQTIWDSMSLRVRNTVVVCSTQCRLISVLSLLLIGCRAVYTGWVDSTSGSRAQLCVARSHRWC